MTESLPGVLLVAALLITLTRWATRRAHAAEARDLAAVQDRYVRSGFGREMGRVDRVRAFTADRAVVETDWDAELRRITEGER